MSRQASQKGVEAAKESRREYMRRWRESNRDHVRNYHRKWTEGNESRKSYMSEFNRKQWDNAESQEAERKRKRLVNYNLTAEGFNALWLEQKGQCAICNVSLVPKGRSANSAVVDHNHDTGEVRGILCRPCNSGIGYLKDSPDILQNAADYLMLNGHYASSKGTG